MPEFAEVGTPAVRLPFQVKFGQIYFITAGNINIFPNPPSSSRVSGVITHTDKWAHTSIDIDTLPEAVGIDGAGQRCALLRDHYVPVLMHGGASARQGKQPGRARRKPIDCWLESSSWVCAVCVRSGWDLRTIFCPFGMVGV
jgi:hypothetical protein